MTTCSECYGSGRSVCEKCSGTGEEIKTPYIECTYKGSSPCVNQRIEISEELAQFISKHSVSFKLVRETETMYFKEVGGDY